MIIQRDEHLFITLWYNYTTKTTTEGNSARRASMTEIISMKLSRNMNTFVMKKGWGDY